MPAGVARPKVAQQKQRSYEGVIEAMLTEYTDYTGSASMPA